MANQIESICIGPMSEEALKELVERAVPVSLSASKEADYFLWLGSTRDFSVDIVRRPTLERLEARALPRELRFALGVGLVYPREHRDSAVRAAARVVAALVREHDADLVWLRRGDMIGLVRCDGEVFIDEREHWDGSVVWELRHHLPAPCRVAELNWEPARHILHADVPREAVRAALERSLRAPVQVTDDPDEPLWARASTPNFTVVVVQRDAPGTVKLDACEAPLTVASEIYFSSYSLRDEPMVDRAVLRCASALLEAFDGDLVVTSETGAVGLVRCGGRVLFDDRVFPAVPTDELPPGVQKAALGSVDIDAI